MSPRGDALLNLRYQRKKKRLLLIFKYLLDSRRRYKMKESETDWFPILFFAGLQKSKLSRTLICLPVR